MVRQHCQHVMLVVFPPDTVHIEQADRIALRLEPFVHSGNHVIVAANSLAPPIG